ncbi:hypothetical protein BKA58DRAFT_392003 [Alternaria rosae]|uniref:uncharacterized protein n=1 Tax=Alternaria rosae TaxID=1187941 RepID=UPI001E8ECC2A|nr:uncharacterized protein BKA58DRAFT_392003 [Alternaria rosae]KAH6860697.1 hypothetical protein BKA58DRAFT_392003 [Alternaria rosae]
MRGAEVAVWMGGWVGRFLLCVCACVCIEDRECRRSGSGGVNWFRWMRVRVRLGMYCVACSRMIPDTRFSISIS